MKYIINTMIDGITPAYNETKAAIQYSSGAIKGVIIVVSLFLLAIWLGS